MRARALAKRHFSTLSLRTQSCHLAPSDANVIRPFSRSSSICTEVAIHRSPQGFVINTCNLNTARPTREDIHMRLHVTTGSDTLCKLSYSVSARHTAFGEALKRPREVSDPVLARDSSARLEETSCSCLPRVSAPPSCVSATTNRLRQLDHFRACFALCRCRERST